jgi:hypothetical protein
MISSLLVCALLCSPHITSHHISSQRITTHHIIHDYTTTRHIPDPSKAVMISSLLVCALLYSPRITSHHITSHLITSHHNAAIHHHYTTTCHIPDPSKAVMISSLLVCALLYSPRITSHHLASHRITSHHISSHLITTHHIIHHYTTTCHIPGPSKAVMISSLLVCALLYSPRITSHHISSQRITPHHTAGPPKAVMISHDNITWTTSNICEHYMVPLHCHDSVLVISLVLVLSRRCFSSF